MSNFERAFNLVIGEEGGYVNDPQDPGGETKFGISKRSYPNVDIKQLTLEQAKQIYKRDYWDKLFLDTQKWHIALLMFDCAVNQGVGAAGSFYEKVQTKGVETFTVDFQVERALHYASLKTFGRFGKGWMRRLFRTFREANIP
jgi:lysozyme family protein